MARSDKRYSVYPSPKAIQVLGASSPCLNQAIECWAGVIARATADNANKFSRPHFYGMPPLLKEHPLDDWCVLAEAIKDKPFDPEFANPAELLATAVEYAQRFDNVSDKWFRRETDASDEDYVQRRDESIQGLAKKLRELDYAHAWAIIIAVQWYWEHSGEVDIRVDPWWTLGFRRMKEHTQTLRSRGLQMGKSQKGTNANQD